MRVRLSYSVELEDVPDAVAELIEGELYRLENAKEGVGKALEALSHEEPHLDLVAKALDKTRQLLGAIDVRLNECESILAGYERAMNPPEPQPQPVPRAPAGPPKVYDYKPPYTVPDAPAEDQQFDGEPE
jgi:hypothetical protein